MKKGLVRFKNEFGKQTSIAVIAAFGFLIALSWRDFISELITHLTGSLNNIASVYVYKLIAAIMVTVVSVLGIMIISKLNTSKKK